ncbi:hypothetical protein Poly30_08880 [Planctomycetes bacterium Poly30]|uniref:Right handed beta helix domain-containing protein n=1 Tax=Saltatorellus ferox TaxID=2528018 RepID=A0A518EMU3_9BACT|nr:hypothetical protein Poly30_08880 [Planctomycetes bacterium Poly30]
MPPKLTISLAAAVRRAARRHSFRRNAHLATRAAVLLAATTVGAGSLHAQVDLSGNLSDSTTGALLSGTVYHATGSIRVPTGATLTIQPGAIVKFAFDRQFTIDGTLNCTGTSLNPVIFTDLRDDSAGGDTNGDGSASVPAPAWWRGVHYNASASSSQTRGLTIRYSGRFISGFYLVNNTATFSDCLSEFSSSSGFDLTSSSLPSMLRCTARDNDVDAFTNVPLVALPRLDTLAASGNGRDVLNVTVGTVPAATSITVNANNVLSGACTLSSNLMIPASSELHLGPGVAIKMGFDREVSVNGELDCNGTSANRVIFTDERDDTVGGDSNGDGAATAPAANHWRGINFGPGSDSSVLEGTMVRYAGRFIAGLEMTGTSPTLRNCVVSESSSDGVDLNASSRPTIEGLTVQNCGRIALASVELEAVASFSGLQFSGNALDQLEVTSATLEAGEALTVERTQGHLDSFYLNTSVNVRSGASLTVGPGVAFKMGFDKQWNVDGTVRMNGTAASRIRITDSRDDSVGGDSNGDGGITLPERNWWRGVQFNDASDGSVLSFTDVRYAGRFISSIELDNASITLDRVTVDNGALSGIDFNNNPEPCVVERVRVNDCSGPAIDNVRLERLQDIELAAGTGNGQNTVRVTSGTLSGNVTIEPNNQFNGSILVDTSINVPSGFELSLQPGVVLKMGFDRSFVVAGRLAVRGSFDQPVILTDSRDDSVGGDTNGDGASSSPAANWWRGLDLNSTSDASIVIGLEVRYAGRFGPSVHCRSGLAAMREVRSSHSGSAGFRVSAHAVLLERLIAFANAGDGLELTGGSFDVRQVTCASNGGVGIDATSAFTGTVRDSIVWANTAAQVAGLGAGQVRYSDGITALAGTNGNIDTDPLFVDLARGNLRLTQSSPCINAGDPASAVDPDSTRADMGARFFNFCEPAVICQQPVSFPPCTPVLSYSGFASLSSPQPFLLVLENAPVNSFAIFFYGIGSPSLINGAFGDICVGGPFKRTAPVPSGGSPLGGPCTGRFEVDLRAYLQSGADPAIVAGSNVIGHLWYRYAAAPGNARFSDGIQLPVCP